MSPGATRSDHHGIGHAGLTDEIDDDGVDRFVVTKRCFDEMLEIVVRRFGSRLGTYDDDPPFIRLARQSHCLARDRLAKPPGVGSRYWRCDAGADGNTPKLVDLPGPTRLHPAPGPGEPHRLLQPDQLTQNKNTAHDRKRQWARG